MLVVRAITSLPGHVASLFKSSPPKKQLIIAPTTGECIGCFEKRGRSDLHEGDHRHPSPYCNGCFLNFMCIRLSEAGVTGRVAECPHPGCKECLTAADLARFGMNPTLIDTFSKFVATKDLRWVQCGGCKRGIEFNKDALTIQCPCQPAVSLCPKCALPSHGSSACTKATDGDEELRRLLLTRGFRECPGCKEFVERNAGCSHMSHVKCNSHFCYDCGAQLRSDGFSEFTSGNNHFPNGSSAPCSNSALRPPEDSMY